LPSKKKGDDAMIEKPEMVDGRQENKDPSPDQTVDTVTPNARWRTL